MKAPLNRRVFVVGYGAATPLGKTFETTWQRAVNGEAGFRRLTRFQMDSGSAIVGEIPDWDPMALDFMAPREAYNWNAGYHRRPS
jgi:3-oxoacyl-[acyl-carrier-protein] synthase II